VHELAITELLIASSGGKRWKDVESAQCEVYRKREEGKNRREQKGI